MRACTTVSYCRGPAVSTPLHERLQRVVDDVRRRGRPRLDQVTDVALHLSPGQLPGRRQGAFLLEIVDEPDRRAAADRLHAERAVALQMAHEVADQLPPGLPDSGEYLRAERCARCLCPGFRQFRWSEPGHGAPGRDRTCDQVLRRHLLYPLSYGRSRRRSSHHRADTAESMCP